MRYQNWDALLFHERSKIPMQEFKTSCHVVHDHEYLYSQNNMLLLPTVTSFIPALPLGEPFRLSLHCWEDPEPSRYTQSLSKHEDLIMFEARVFIDGRLAGAKIFGRLGPWPTIIDSSIVMDKNGELESLKFPSFHRELLTQSYWNAGDELGRVKVIIAEGYLRDALSVSLERVKNIVAFSFQHAPLDVLEASAIAWPNAAMWRQISYSVPYVPQASSPRQAADESNVEAHTHSPRRRTTSLVRPALPIPSLGQMLPPNVPIFPRAGNFDPFTEPAPSHWRQPSSTDISMPDYSSSASHTSQSRRVTDPMITDRPERRYETLQCAGAFESICEALLPSAPVNTPQNEFLEEAASSLKGSTANTQSDCSSGRYEESHATPMLGSSVAGVKSRKENLHDIRNGNGIGPSHDGTRKFAQPITNKRQRVITPAAFKVIDEEDEPRSSPTLRKASQSALAMDAKETERRVLSGIEPNIL